MTTALESCTTNSNCYANTSTLQFVKYHNKLHLTRQTDIHLVDAHNQRSSILEKSIYICMHVHKNVCVHTYIYTQEKLNMHIRAYRLRPTSSKSTPHSVAISRIKSEALASALIIKSCPESTKSNIAA